MKQTPDLLSCRPPPPPVYVGSVTQPNHCFGCGPANPHGLHLTFEIQTTPANGASPSTIQARTVVNLSSVFEGHPGFLHGGIIATLMDEAMSKLSHPLGVRAMTRHMEVDYLRPAPVDTALALTGTHLRREGRKLFNKAELHAPDGTLLARATGLFIAI